mgnify:CR=1 FL=1
MLSITSVKGLDCRTGSGAGSENNNTSQHMNRVIRERSEWQHRSEGEEDIITTDSEARDPTGIRSTMCVPAPAKRMMLGLSFGDRSWATVCELIRQRQASAARAQTWRCISIVSDALVRIVRHYRCRTHIYENAAVGVVKCRDQQIQGLCTGLEGLKAHGKEANCGKTFLSCSVRHCNLGV